MKLFVLFLDDNDNVTILLDGLCKTFLSIKVHRLHHITSDEIRAAMRGRMPALNTALNYDLIAF